MRVVLRTLVSVGLVVFALYLLNWESLASVVRETDVASFVSAIVVILLSFVFLALRWMRIVNAYVELPKLEHWRVYFYASFFNSFTPANIGGDVYRATALKRHASGLAVLVMALLRERLFGLLSFLAGYVVCLAAYRIADPAGFARLDPIYSLALLPVLVGIAGLTAGAPFMRWVLEWSWVVARPRFKQGLEDLARAMVLHSPLNFLGLLGLSLLALAAWIAAVVIIAADLGVALSIPLIGAIAVLTELVRLVPISLQGIGLREGSFSVLVGLAGGSPESGFVLGAWSYVALSLALLACGPIAWGLGTINPQSRPE